MMLFARNQLEDRDPYFDSVLVTACKLGMRALAEHVTSVSLNSIEDAPVFPARF